MKKNKKCLPDYSVTGEGLLGPCHQEGTSNWE